MKKTYITPTIREIVLNQSIMNTGSSGSDHIQAVVNNTPINYGGVDEDGTIVPSSRRSDWWDDEDEY